MRLKDAPIKSKLMLVILATSTAALFVTASAFIGYERLSFRNDLRDRMATLGQIVAANSAAALAYLDPEAAYENLASLEAEPEIAAAALYTPDGKLFTNYVAPFSSIRTPQDLSAAREVGFRDGYFIRLRSVVASDEPLGALWIAADLDQSYQRFSSYVAILIVVLGASLLIAIAVSAFLQSTISAPILALAGAAKTISQRRDYSVRVPRNSQDEIGALTDAFNDMLEQILRRDQALREGTERLRLALEASQTGTWTWNLETDRMIWDDACHKLFGLEPGEFNGAYEQALSMVHPADRAMVDRILRGAVDTGSEFLVEFRALWPNGEVHHLAARGKALLNELGRPVQMTGVSMDITQSREAEKEIRRLNAELEKRVEERTAELASANRELEAFTYSVSHDLRAPLRHIDGYARILVEDFAPHLPVQAKKYIERIRHGTVSMGELIDDLLNLGRVGRQEVNFQETDLNQLVAECLSKMESEIQDRRIEWRIGALPTLRCDKGLVRQVFVNLLSNAVKYSRPREIARIEIGQAGADRERALFVRDNGVGFNMKHAGRLFGAFHRLHREDEFEGNGVGLALVDRIVRKHGGRVWAEAELDRGAAFYFTLNPSKNSHDGTKDPPTNEI